MSQLLDQAVAEARKLTDDQQDAIAALIFQDDRKWEDSFACSPGKLAALAARAVEQVRKGHCKTARFDQ